jgi:quinol monooxygenase YgiN
MSHLEMSARMRIRPGRLEGFKTQAAELMRLTREQDTHTLRYDWFVNEDGTECEVHEAYENEQGLVEHNQHIMEARNVLFRDFADDHRMAVYGEISPELGELFKVHAGGVARYTFMHGLQLEPTV